MSNHKSTALSVFSDIEYQRAKILLATKVAGMMGRKLEEQDWTEVYCGAKTIPIAGWSNLHIDINHRGLGVEQKLLRVGGLKNGSILSVCGTTMMHPASTRSIRIDDTNLPAQQIMDEVFGQYTELIEQRTETVRRSSSDAQTVGMRIGWLLWESSLTEFLYFEQSLIAPDPKEYYAGWNITPPKGTRKGSKSLWMFEEQSHKKRFSVTTSAGIKIQPYFDVPAPSDPNLYYFQVQHERIDNSTVQIWVSALTASNIKQQVGDLSKETISTAILTTAQQQKSFFLSTTSNEELAIPIHLTQEAYECFCSTWDGVSDEHRARLFLHSLLHTPIPPHSP